MNASRTPCFTGRFRIFRETAGIRSLFCGRKSFLRERFAKTIAAENG